MKKLTKKQKIAILKKAIEICRSAGNNKSCIVIGEIISDKYILSNNGLHACTTGQYFPEYEIAVKKRLRELNNGYIIGFNYKRTRIKFMNDFLKEFSK